MTSRLAHNLSQPQQRGVIRNWVYGFGTVWVTALAVLGYGFGTVISVLGYGLGYGLGAAWLRTYGLVTVWLRLGDILIPKIL